MLSFRRRQFLTGLAAILVTAGKTGTSRAGAAPAGLRFGPAQSFSPAWLRARARALAAHPYRPASSPASHIIQGIDYDRVQKIRFRLADALWRGSKNADPVALFHLNRYSGDPVTIFALDANTAREILYTPEYFDYGDSGLNPADLRQLGFAGFRVLDGQDKPTDWLAFQGASYFRSSGPDGQYGASARGLALNTGLSTPEEFPRFSEFWLAANTDGITIHALLEGPSVTGAYRFTCRHDNAVTMDVHCDLFFRNTPARLGIAPLTSMFWYGENDRPASADWRPEIHDSDGLSLWNGKGERIWRPLVDPPLLQVNSFQDLNPKGFGLMQRDRDFDHYQDDGAFYNRRPGLWIEPLGAWGAGAVELVEIPTDGETFDNIVAYWRPAEPARSGAALSFDYRLSWCDHEPDYPAALGRALATRIGRGGVPGQNPWPANRRKFSIDFSGGALSQLQQRFDLTPVISISRGTVQDAHVLKVLGTDRWRVLFDITREAKTAVDLRCFLRLGDTTLTETWIYQYFP